nr:hypothetical protein BaRGS_034952 [Batillaria attramentaria]
MKKLGAFFVKKEEDEDDIQTGALFASRGKKEEAAATPPPTGAAAVRAASRLAEESRAASSRSPAGRGRNSDSPSKAAAAVGSPKASPATSKAAASPSKGRKKHAVSDEDGDTEEDEPAPRRTSLKRQSTSVSSVASSRSADAPPPLKKTRTEPPKPSPAKEFTRLMEKVVFVLSGFQNPYRGELREKALEMGAQYKPDWGKGCTHLVCAFPNTPKYNQVNGRGRIVSKQWIIDCHKQKKLLPWRKYRLGDADSPGDSSEEEEEITRPKKATPQKTLSKKGSASKTPTPSKKKEEPEADIYGGDTDSADDTDEELRRAKVKAAAMQKGKESKSQKEDSTKEDVEAKEKKEVKATEDPTLALFADSTDEDEPSGAAAAMDTDDDGADSGLPDLPDFFADKHFFFYGDFDAKERRLLTRYVAAYDGVLEDYMNDRVKYVVTSAKWDDNFDQALSENPGLVFVKPKWIHACHDKNKLLPHQPYVVVP